MFLNFPQIFLKRYHDKKNPFNLVQQLSRLHLYIDVSSFNDNFSTLGSTKIKLKFENYVNLLFQHSKSNLKYLSISLALPPAFGLDEVREWMKSLLDHITTQLQFVRMSH